MPLHHGEILSARRPNAKNIDGPREAPWAARAHHGVARKVLNVAWRPKDVEGQGHHDEEGLHG